MNSRVCEMWTFINIRQHRTMNNKKYHHTAKQNRGFTLIELMIAVAVISILAAIAVPTYLDYTVRAKISEALNIVSAAKTSITEYYISQGTLPSNATQAGVPNLSTNYIDSIGYGRTGNSGQITVTLSNNVGGDANGKSLTITTTPDANGALLTWTCATASSNGVAAKYLPANCR